MNYWWWKKRDAALKALDKLLEESEFVVFCKDKAIIYAKNQSVMITIKKMADLLAQTFDGIHKEIVAKGNDKDEHDKVRDTMKEISSDIDHAFELLNRIDATMAEMEKIEKEKHAVDDGEGGAKA